MAAVGIERVKEITPGTFSLIDGGPSYRLLRWLGLAEKTPSAIGLRIAVMFGVAWLPLLVLTFISGQAIGGNTHPPFLYDFAIYGKFLLGLPLLIIAEMVIDAAIGKSVNHFRSSGLVPAGEMPAFEALLERARQQRDGVLPETLLFVLSAFPMFLLNREWMLASQVHWHSTVNGPTPAGWWFAVVSSLIIRFLMFRWVWRFVIWASFLARVSRLKLELVATHPDLTGGLGFLSSPQRRFGMIFAAFGCSFAGEVANQIAYQGAHITDLRGLMIAYVVMAVVIDLAPLALLAPALAAVKRGGILTYGALGNQYTQAFERKWVKGDNPKQEPFLGTGDIQSLADLANSFDIVRGMRVAPISKTLAIQVAVQAAAPMIPVILFATPAEQLVNRVLKMLL